MNEMTDRPPALEAAAREIRASLKPGETMSFVSGNFNVVHPGHLRMFKFATDIADKLIVGVNPDDYPGASMPSALRLEGVKAISVVHRAVALDGTKLACKLQYPEMASAVEADLRQLRLAMGLYERYDRAVSTADIHAEIAARLREELDYTREAAHMRLYGEILKDETGVAVPTPYAELSTGRLLTMRWLEGGPILDIAKAPLKQRNEIALRMFRIWYLPFYYYGVIHGDPHLGNYTVTPENSADRTVNLLDFGCVRVFPASFVKGVIDLYHALERDDDELAVHAYKSWGFGDLSKEIIAVLNRWARFVYGPLLDDRARPIQEKRGEPEGPRLVDSVHHDLRRLGGIAPPRAFVFMDRAAVGLGSVFMHLKAEINWHRLFHELIDDFDEATLARRQTAALQRAGVPAEAG